MFCAKCGTKVPEDSKFCPKCGGGVTEETTAKEKPKHSRAYKITNVAGFAITGLIIIGFIFYLIEADKFRNLETYKHPAMGFSIKYSKNLKIDAPTLPSGSKCSKNPCLIAFKDPSYGNESVNWIFVLPAADLGKDFIAGATKGFKEDVSKGEASIITIGEKTVYKYVNDFAKPSVSLNEFYQTFGFIASREQSMYAFIASDAIVLVGFRMPPPGAPSDYGDYLDIDTLVIP